MYELKLDLKPKIKKLEITSRKGISGTNAGGGATSRMSGAKRADLFRGKGLEFEKFREFSPDDDATMIDWKSSLKAKKLLVRTYTEEQNKDIVFFLDVSSSMSCSSHPKLKNEFSIELIVNLAYGSNESGDNMGLVMFTDKLVCVVPPVSGIKHFYKITKTLKNTSLYDGSFNFERCAINLNGLLKREAIILVISDFIGLNSEWERGLKILAKRNEVIGIVIRDPIDDILPGSMGQVVISDPFSEEELLIEPDRIQNIYERMNKERLREIRRAFQKIKSDAIILNTNEDFTKKITRFFRGH